MKVFFGAAPRSAEHHVSLYACETCTCRRIKICEHCQRLKLQQPDTHTKHACEPYMSMTRTPPPTTRQGKSWMIIPRMLAMTVVTSKLQASAAIMTPPGRPNTRKLDSTWADKPDLTATHALPKVTPERDPSCSHAMQVFMPCGSSCTDWSKWAGLCQPHHGQSQPRYTSWLLQCGGNACRVVIDKPNGQVLTALTCHACQP